MITKSLILAAGKGTRMKSDLPKVLHTVNGIPMVMHVIHAVQKATGEKPVLVVGYKADQVKNAVGPHADYVVQTEQLGTAHAVQTGEPALKNSCDLVFVTYGDMPLLRVTTIQKLIEAQTNHTGPFTMLTAVANDPRGFGRVIRDEAGNVQAIVEEAVATPEILAVKELNTGVYCFNNSWLWENIKKVTLSPKGEYYLTDLVEIAVRQGNSVQALVANDINEVIGVNTLEHLADAEHALNLRAQEGK